MSLRSPTRRACRTSRFDIGAVVVRKPVVGIRAFIVDTRIHTSEKELPQAAARRGKVTRLPCDYVWVRKFSA